MTHASQRILLVEGIHPRAKSILERESFGVELLTYSPSEDELIRLIREGEYVAVGLRSKTKYSTRVIESCPSVLTIGAFCIGTDQVALADANRRGIPVFNAPYSNTRSVAELVIAEVIALSRQMTERSQKAHIGEWIKSAEGSREVRGKTLGIVGYGHIGSQLSVLAESLGLKVRYFDVVKKLPLGNSQPCRTLEDLLAESDFVSLHVPDTAQTRNMITLRELRTMQKGSYLINASRGGVVDIDALAEVLRSGHLAGAAIDVFPHEPSSNKEKFSSPLQGLANVILTPHIGGSTEEAQESIGAEVAQSFLQFLRNGSTRGAVNFPNVDLPVLHLDSHRIVNVHRNVPGVLSEINGIVSDVGANIEAQSLVTDPHIGYLVMDMAKGEAHQVATRVESLETSIRTRVLF